MGRPIWRNFVSARDFGHGAVCIWEGAARRGSIAICSWPLEHGRKRSEQISARGKRQLFAVVTYDKSRLRAIMTPRPRRTCFLALPSSPRAANHRLLFISLSLGFMCAVASSKSKGFSSDEKTFSHNHPAAPWLNKLGAWSGERSPGYARKWRSELELSLKKFF